MERQHVEVEPNPLLKSGDDGLRLMTGKHKTNDWVDELTGCGQNKKIIGYEYGHFFFKRVREIWDYGLQSS